MRNKIKTIVDTAVKTAIQNGELSPQTLPEILIEEPKAALHGDFSTNIAMAMASFQKMAPRKLSDIILKNVKDPANLISRTEIAGPGFINFFIAPEAWLPVLEEIHDLKDRFGSSMIGEGKKVQVEFVSANPTGPLHVGHGRGAAVGDAVANILSFAGYDVQREYYINDSGRQINTLGRSVFLRLKELMGETVAFPDDCYQGDYIKGLARTLLETRRSDFSTSDEEAQISICARFAAQSILDGIRADLESFGVQFDAWYSEQSLFDQGKVDAVIQAFKEDGHVYEKEGAFWFNTSRYGDEKDRVIVRSNGQTTYFASDIAYHHEKFIRGFDRIIDVWGADHHGYIPRIRASASRR